MQESPAAEVLPGRSIPYLCTLAPPAKSNKGICRRMVSFITAYNRSKFSSQIPASLMGFVD